MQKVLTIIGAAGALGILVLAGVIAWFYVWQPRQELRAFDAFVAVHKEGTPIQALVADPFVLHATDLTFDEASLKDVQPGGPARQLERFKARLAEPSPSGVLELTWTHTPPFGRVFLHVEFADGGITSLKTSDLD